MIPVVGRRADYFVEFLGRPVASDFVDSRNILVFEAFHQVGGSSDRVFDLFVILMSGRNDAVRFAPLADRFRISRCVKLGPQTEQGVPRGLRFRADVVPECRIVQRRAGAVFFYVGLVECRRPATGLRAVQRRFVEKGRSDRLSEIFGHPFVVSLVRHRNVGFGRLFAQIIHVRIVVRDADELHDFPVPFGYFPDDGFLGDVA